MVEGGVVENVPIELHTHAQFQHYVRWITEKPKEYRLIDVLGEMRMLKISFFLRWLCLVAVVVALADCAGSTGWSMLQDVLSACSWRLSIGASQVRGAAAGRVPVFGSELSGPSLLYYWYCL